MRQGMVMGAMLLAGCSTIGIGEKEKAPSVETMRFTAGPCLGICPSYSVEVTAKGSGELQPQRNTAVPGATRFTVTPAQYKRFKSTFAPYRPLAGTTKRVNNRENCSRFATDMPSYSIEWKPMGGKPSRLEFQSGCLDPRYTRLRGAISSVPRLLDIEAMVKPERRS